MRLQRREKSQIFQSQRPESDFEAPPATVRIWDSNTNSPATIGLPPCTLVLGTLNPRLPGYTTYRLEVGSSPMTRMSIVSIDRWYWKASGRENKISNCSSVELLS
eukprot:1809405-Rhodomonas_salina.1